MKAGDKVKLTGKTKHGKNRVREQGQDWVVVKVAKNKLLSDSWEKDFALLMQPDNQSEDWRWVAVQDDKNFDIEVLSNNNEDLESV